MIKEDQLIKKKGIFDSLEDDNDIDWKTNPFDIDPIDEESMSKITFERTPQFQTWLKVRSFKDVEKLMPNSLMFLLQRNVESPQQ
jgi:hypothetical protein